MLLRVFQSLLKIFFSVDPEKEQKCVIRVRQTYQVSKKLRWEVTSFSLSSSFWLKRPKKVRRYEKTLSISKVTSKFVKTTKINS